MDHLGMVGSMVEQPLTDLVERWNPGREKPPLGWILALKQRGPL